MIRRHPQDGTLGRAALVLLCVLALWPAVGCAARHAPRVNADIESYSSVSAFIAKTQTLAAQAKPKSGKPLDTLEAFSPGLHAALVDLDAHPSGAGERRVALEYLRLGVLDSAYDHFEAAIRLDRADADAYEGIARIWRDWGFPNLGFDDARRAVSLAPSSPAAANTLGTLHEGVGDLSAAKAWFQRAVALDPSAAYALNNLCYVSILQRDPHSVGDCRRAVDAEPESAIAHNNLALAYAAAGNFDAARAEFSTVGQVAGMYNMGMVYMATGQYGKAILSFDAALQTYPGFTLAAERSRQARAHAGNE